MLKCVCEKWKKNASSLIAGDIMGALHGMPYEGDLMEFCPFCAEKLFEEVPTDDATGKAAVDGDI